MSGDLKFNGPYASEFGLRIGGVNVHSAAENIMETLKVPGRQGNIIPSGEDFDMQDELREYTAALYMRNASAADVTKRLSQIRDWLMNTRSGAFPKTGYKTLKDSYEPGFYRRAVFYGAFTPHRKGAGQNFEIPLQFLCDPHRYIDNVPDEVMAKNSGITVLTIIPPEGWENLVVYPAKPLIKFEGSGTNAATNLIFTDVSETEIFGKITFDANIGTVYFDTETLNATSEPYGGANLNSWITDVTGDINLNGLVDYIKRSSTSAKITVTPRWWVR